MDIKKLKDILDERQTHMVEKRIDLDDQNLKGEVFRMDARIEELDTILWLLRDEG